MTTWRVWLQPMVLCVVLFGVLAGVQIFRTDLAIRGWTTRTISALSEALAGVSRSGLAQVYGAVEQKVVQLEGWAGLTVMPNNIIIDDMDGWIYDALLDLKRQMGFLQVDCVNRKGVCIASTDRTAMTTRTRHSLPLPAATTLEGPLGSGGRTVLVLEAPVPRKGPPSPTEIIGCLKATVDWSSLTETVFGTVRSSAVGEEAALRFLVFDRKGEVLASSFPVRWRNLGEPGLEWVLDRSVQAPRSGPVMIDGTEFAIAAATGWDADLRSGPGPGPGRGWSARLTRPRWGFMVLQTYRTAIGATDRDAWRDRILTILFTSGTTLLLFGLLIWRFVAPTLRVAAFAERVSEGHVAGRLDPAGGREFKILTNAINQMLERQERARAEIAAARDYIESVLRSMHNALIVVDRDLIVRTVNRSTLELLGYSEAEIVSRSFQTLYRAEDWAAARAEVDRVFDQGFIENRPFQLLTKGGETIPVTFSASVLRDATGAVAGIVGVAHDLREVLGLQKELAHRQKLASLGRLAAGLAHEIRNPLAVVKFAASYLRKHTACVHESRTEKVAQSFEDIDKELGRVGHLIDDLLSFSKPPAPDPQGAALDDLFKELEDHLTKRQELGQVQLAVTLPDDLPRVSCSRDSLMRVLLNLCMNALEAMNGQGRLTVSAGLDTRAGEERMRIAVVDTGPGITPENLDRAFEPFFTTKRRGTGLGLYICDQTVRGMGGTLEATSEAGKGSCFVVWLRLLGREGGPKVDASASARDR